MAAIGRRGRRRQRRLALPLHLDDFALAVADARGKAGEVGFDRQFAPGWVLGTEVQFEGLIGNGRGAQALIRRKEAGHAWQTYIERKAQGSPHREGL